MFELNPLQQPNAWWQQVLMLLVSAILGYIIGYISKKNEIEDLETQLVSLDTDLDNCLRSKSTTLGGTLAAGVNAFNNALVVADNLKIIEGIGPKIEEILNHAGIITFAQLANTPAQRVKEILLAHNEARYRIHDPSTWGQQAALARDGKMDELNHWQNQLNKGKVQ